MTTESTHHAISSAMRATSELTHYAGQPHQDPRGLLEPAAMCLDAFSVMLHELADQRGSGAATASSRVRAYQVAWELHRAGEMTHQIAISLGRVAETLPTRVAPATTTPTGPGPRVAS